MGELNRCNWVTSEFHPHFHIDISQISHRRLRCLVHKTRITAGTFRILLPPPPPPVPQLSPWPRNPHSPQARSLTATAPLSFSPAAHFSFKPMSHLFCLCVLSESSFCSHHHHLSSEPLRHLLHGESASWGTGSLSAKASPLPV